MKISKFSNILAHPGYAIFTTLDQASLKEKQETEEAERIAAFLASEQARIASYEAEYKVNETAHASWT